MIDKMMASEYWKNPDCILAYCGKVTDGFYYICPGCRKCESLGVKMEEGYAIGSQWRTRGGWRAVIVDNDVTVYHEKYGEVRTHYALNGRYDCQCDTNWDLMEPWVEKRSGAAYLQVHNSGDMLLKVDGTINFYHVDPVVAMVKVEWTEGQFDE